MIGPCSDFCKVKQSKKKPKSKCKSSNIHKRNKIQRTPLDLPTTDPGSDIQFSTDDELYLDGYGTIPRARRTLIQNEMHRKYATDVNYTQQMPPELIVTPAKNKLNESLRHTTDKEKKVLASPTITEFPPIGIATKRTNSWHNLNKCGPKINLSNLRTAETGDMLQFRLNLKKQIWTGVSPDCGPGGDRSLPLSWGMPPIGKKKTAALLKDEQEALLTACCQKLTEWQENENGSYVQTKNKVTINLITPVLTEKIPKTKKSANIKETTKTDIPELKVNKKRNPLAKIAETTQILTRLAKTKSKSSLHGRKSSKSGLNFPSTSGTVAASLTPLPKGHKFKTGGIVATVVQPLKKKKSNSVPLLKENTTESDFEKSFGKKIKSKTKKKKKSS